MQTSGYQRLFQLVIWPGSDHVFQFLSDGWFLVKQVGGFMRVILEIIKFSSTRILFEGQLMSEVLATRSFKSSPQ